ncbi:MAG: hypothetical protein WAK21_07275, partial [Candidatus Sulfotelmatobacter sp.]
MAPQRLSAGLREDAKVLYGGDAGAAQASGERWRHLTLTVVCMIMIANLQYGWSVFVLPLQRAHGWPVSAIQVVFTIFIALETWATPLNGWIADRLGPRIGPRI